jgi:hypothetical protein
LFFFLNNIEKPFYPLFLATPKPMIHDPQVENHWSTVCIYYTSTPVRQLSLNSVDLISVVLRCYKFRFNLYLCLFCFIWLWSRKVEKLNLKTTSCLSRQNYIVLSGRSGDLPLCLICHQIVAIFNNFNFKRHYETLHKSVNIFFFFALLYMLYKYFIKSQLRITKT